MFMESLEKSYKERLKTMFVDGVKEAVARFEQDEIFQTWMEKKSFRTAFTNEIVSLVKKVKGHSK